MLGCGWESIRGRRDGRVEEISKRRSGQRRRRSGKWESTHRSEALSSTASENLASDPPATIFSSQIDNLALWIERMRKEMLEISVVQQFTGGSTFDIGREKTTHIPKLLLSAIDSPFLVAIFHFDGKERCLRGNDGVDKERISGNLTPIGSLE